MNAVASRGEVIVVDNNSDDATAAVAATCGARVVHEPINQISRARNTGAANAVGKYLIFVDADTLISAPVLINALSALASARVCGGGARVAIEHSSRVANLAVSMWNVVAKNARLAAGCFIYARRDAFLDVGGFSDQVYASEEIWLSLALKRWGKKRRQRFEILPDAVLTSARKVDWLSASDILKQTLIILVFPFALTSRRFCSAWYRRPNDRRQ